MKSFSNYITESKAGKNLHMEHIEDRILDLGVAGVRESINYFRALRDMLKGESKSSVKITVKWDGAPAVFVGIDPEDGQFFVGTKGVFNAVPKLNKTPEDIDANHPSEGLNKKLKLALKYLPALGIKGRVLQGDIMFSQEDLTVKNIKGEKYLTFQPNTIAYAIPVNSQLAKDIKKTKLGVVFHTEYKGSSLQSMSAKFGPDIKGLKKTANVWFRDAEYEDVSGQATMTADETKVLGDMLSQMGRIFHKLDSKILNGWAADTKLSVQIKAYNNSRIRKGQSINSPVEHAAGLFRYLDERFKKEIDKVKTQKSKDKKEQARVELLTYMVTNRKNVVAIFEMQKLMQEAKILIINQLRKVRALTKTFVQTADGYDVTSDEGFVAVSKLTGEAVKLVDRLEFSMQNFNAVKSWT